MRDSDIFQDSEAQKPEEKRYKRQRAQLLPLGGMLGERVAKSMSIYGKDYNPTEGQPGNMRKSKAIKQLQSKTRK